MCNNNGLFYLVKFKSNDSGVIASHRARLLWPQLVIHFLEERLVWIPHVHFAAPDQLRQPDNVDAVPISIDCKHRNLLVFLNFSILFLIMISPLFSDVTRIGRDLLYLVTWQDGSKFFASKVVAKKWPVLLINFLERNLMV